MNIENSELTRTVEDVEGHSVRCGLTDDDIVEAAVYVPTPDDVHGHNVRCGVTDDTDDTDGHSLKSI